MECKVIINDFEGPLDLLLHLIKKSNIDIYDISVLEITNQYIDFIHQMEELNLNIASEYLIMAAELLEMKSNMLLPHPKLEEDVEEEDPRKKLIERLLEYKQYKEVTNSFKDLEKERKDMFSKEPMDLKDFKENAVVNIDGGNVNDLLVAFEKFLERKNLEKPLNTKIATKEYSLDIRNSEIKSILKEKKKIQFEDLFENFQKDYVVITFLSILDLAKKQELCIKQENNFQKIFLSVVGSDEDEFR